MNNLRIDLLFVRRFGRLRTRPALPSMRAAPRRMTGSVLSVVQLFVVFFVTPWFRDLLPSHPRECDRAAAARGRGRDGEPRIAPADRDRAAGHDPENRAEGDVAQVVPIVFHA